MAWPKVFSKSPPPRPTTPTPPPLRPSKPAPAAPPGMAPARPKADAPLVISGFDCLAPAPVLAEKKARGVFYRAALPYTEEEGVFPFGALPAKLAELEKPCGKYAPAPAGTDRGRIQIGTGARA